MNMRILLALLVSSSTALAQADKPAGALEVGLFGGGHLFANDVELGVVDRPELLLGIEDSWLVGARVGYPLTSVFSAEGELVAIPTQDNLAGNSVFVLGWRAHGLMHLPASGRVRPFLLLGAGALSSFTGREGATEIEDDTDFVPHFGLGVKVDLTSRLALRLDYRQLLPPSTRHKGVTSDVELLAGFSYRFGGAPSPR